MFVRAPILAAAAIAALAANVVAVAPAFAQQGDTVEVSYGDLNLASGAGRAILDARIADAAEQLCGEARKVELTLFAAVEACRTETVAVAQPQRDAAVRYGTVEIASAPVVRVSRAAN